MTVGEVSVHTRRSQKMFRKAALGQSIVDMEE